MRKLFEDFINDELSQISGDYVDLTSGDVHRAVGGYPAKNGNHRMPVCCDVMSRAMRGDDEVLFEPPKGKGATLTIRYYKKNHPQKNKINTTRKIILKKHFRGV
ncbi:hypothetical protein J5690_03425 [bacterium]|nr:hypothetical protein [bacterium]